MRMLRALAKRAGMPEGHDSTVYGAGRASPKSFLRHHLSAISSAIVCADALAIHNRAATSAFALTLCALQI